MSSIYLDNNATTRIDPFVVEQMAQCDAAGYANPASQHSEGRRARRALEQARDELAELLDARDARLIVTSGGTESNNLAIQGIARSARRRRGPAAGIGGRRVILSAIEHPSVTAPAERLQADGWQVALLTADDGGRVDPEQLRALLDEPADLVSVMFGNNETGVLQPIDQIASICREHQTPLHTDAVQAVGKLPVSFRQLDAAAMTLSAHKFHGPRGVGLLLLREPVELEPLLVGGQQQLGLRAGTESVSLVVGMCAALQVWQRQAEERLARLVTLRDRLEGLLLAADPQAVIIGQQQPRLPHTICIAFVGLDRQALVMALDLAGVSCSTGSACASGSSEPSPVLLAMGLEEPIVAGAVRFSLGADTRPAEVDEAAHRISSVVKNLRERTGARKSPVAAPPRAEKSL